MLTCINKAIVIKYIYNHDVEYEMEYNRTGRFTCIILTYLGEHYYYYYQIIMLIKGPKIYISHHGLLE
jgi:hypothetical protein